MTIKMLCFEGNSIAERADELSRILSDSVNAGASISFMSPLALADARHFWLESVDPEVIAKRRVLYAAELNGQLVGTIQLLLDMPPNQAHRGEIAKLIVHPDARKQGLARRLIQAAIAHAKSSGKTLVTLDTRTGDVAEHLYTAIGFKTAGVIPGFAMDPDGKACSATTYMYLQL